MIMNQVENMKRKICIRQLENYLLIITVIMIAYIGVVGAQGMNVSLNPAEGAPGTQVTATGINWQSGHTMHTVWDGDSNKDINQTTIDVNGNFIATFLVPSDAGIGQHVIYFWDEQGRTFYPKYFTVAQPYTVFVSTSPGWLSPQPTGGGSYSAGQIATLTAQYIVGYTFDNWTENGMEVSNNTSYSFTVTGDRNLIAEYVNVPSCQNAKFVIPHSGKLGWPYMDDGQDVLDKDLTIHRGIDIWGKVGDTVYAPYNGKVVAGANVFRIRHSDIGVDTYYGHVTNTVPVGTNVRRGDPIGILQNDYSGTVLPDGSNTHMHFAITKLDKNYNDNNWASELIFANSLDPSPFFNAKLNFFDGTHSAGAFPCRIGCGYDRPVMNWCDNAPVGIIKGVVKTIDGKGVSNATVEIDGLNQSRITDYWMDPNDSPTYKGWLNLNQGNYTFSYVPARKVTITASKDGLSGSVIVDVKASSEITAPDIILQSPPQYASFAYATAERVASVGIGDSQTSAQNDAESKCRQQGGKDDCHAVGWWRDGMSSFAIGPDNQWGWGTDPSTIENADQLALSSCGNDCQLVIRVGIGGTLPWTWGKVKYTITTSTSPTGLSPPPQGGGIYDSGTSITVIAQPIAEYTFQNWTEGGQISTIASYTFAIIGNRNLVAVYSQKGDVNSDEKVTVADALLYLRKAVGQDISPYHIYTSGDVTCDGTITVADALKVLRKAVGQNVTLQC
jgi:murein DD-endopeptidase MepM/ murein hydrolase activator NlpD